MAAESHVDRSIDGLPLSKLMMVHIHYAKRLEPIGVSFLKVNKLLFVSYLTLTKSEFKARGCIFYHEDNRILHKPLNESFFKSAVIRAGYAYGLPTVVTSISSSGHLPLP